MGWLILANSLVIEVAVVIHYECLRILSQLLAKLGFLHRTRMIVGVAGAPPKPHRALVANGTRDDWLDRFVLLRGDERVLGLGVMDYEA